MREKKGLADKRSWNFGLTEAGRAKFAELDAASSAKIAAMLAPAAVPRVRAAMGVIQRQLQGPVEVTLRGLQTGDLGWIAHRQSLLCAGGYGFDQSHDALIARILWEYHTNFKSGLETTFVAEAQGVVGSAFVVQENDTTARLRLLYVEPHLRGQGVGRRLVRECAAFARTAGYGEMVLWTQRILTAARAIYTAEGYRLDTSEPHHSFGVDLAGETWRYSLR